MTQQRDPSEIARIFDAEIAAGDATALAELGPRYNVAPTEPVTVVVRRDDGRRVELHRWGLVPAWSEKPTTRSPLINARAETIAASPAFRTSFVRRRCVIPADGFYEWRREGRRRQPFLIRPPATTGSTPLLAFAGIWAPSHDPATGEWLLSTAVVTTAANATVARLHDRMPVILDADAWRLWLDPTVTDAGLLHDLLKPTDDLPLEFVPVSPLLNNANNKGPELIVPIEGVAALEPQARPLTLFQ